jgi:8-oxo-dGTP pyrophosphatase MutT (NUDIX family)
VGGVLSCRQSGYDQSTLMPISEFLRELRRKVGHDPLLLPAVTAVILDGDGRVLLMRSRDDGKWYLPGGATDPGEQPADAIVREVLEETGLIVEPTRIVGVYADEVSCYANGDKVWYVSTIFACDVISGTPRVNDDEALDVRYFPTGALPAIYAAHRHRIADALKGAERAHFARRSKR